LLHCDSLQVYQAGEIDYASCFLDSLRAMNNFPPFLFQTERRLVSLTGIKAKNLKELLNALREVSGASIFFHTHHKYLSRHFEKPVFYNDFAQWASTALQEQQLAEVLAAINLLEFTSIRQLRMKIINKIENHLSQDEERLRECVPGSEFHFCKSKSFVMPTGLIARDPVEFFKLLPNVTIVSLYYHFFEARLRLGRPTNDFSLWLADLGETELAAEIDRLDPYILTLDELKEAVIDLGRQYLRGLDGE